MVSAKDLRFSEQRKLPAQNTLRGFGIDYNTELQQFENINNSQVRGYPLGEFINDYYTMDFQEFRFKFNDQLGCELYDSGYLVHYGIMLPIRDLAFFANKELKFIKELRTGKERGNWVKTVCRDVRITTSQTNVVADFIDRTISDENLSLSDIIMLKYLKRVDQQVFSIYKIFNSADVRDKKSLLHIVNGYADGFFGQNEDYSEDIDRLELDTGVLTIIWII